MKKTLFTLLLALISTFGMAQLIKERTTNPHYLAGAVPEVDGKVTFTRTLTLPGQSQAQLYDRSLHWLGKYFGREEVLRRKTLHRDSVACSVTVGINEYIVFKNTVLCLDRSQMIYSLQIACTDGACQVTMTDITYYYEEERTPEKYTAEDWITDATALNKKGTKLLPLSDKFRIKTIDKFDDICQSLQAATE